MAGWRFAADADTRSSPFHPMGNASNSFAIASRPSNHSGAGGIAQRTSSRIIPGRPAERVAENQNRSLARRQVLDRRHVRELDGLAGDRTLLGLVLVRR